MNNATNLPINIKIENDAINIIMHHHSPSMADTEMNINSRPIRTMCVSNIKLFKKKNR